MLDLDLSVESIQFLRSLRGKYAGRLPLEMFELMGKEPRRRSPSGGPQKIALRILELLSDPEPEDSQELREAGLRSVEVGEFRIVYYVKGDVLFVPVIGRSGGA